MLQKCCLLDLTIGIGKLWGLYQCTLGNKERKIAHPEMTPCPSWRQIQMKSYFYRAKRGVQNRMYL